MVHGFDPWSDLGNLDPISPKVWPKRIVNKRILYEGSNYSNRQELDTRGTENISINQRETKSNFSNESINGTNRSISSSNSTVNGRGENTFTDSTQLKLDFNQTLETKQTTEEIIEIIDTL